MEVKLLWGFVVSLLPTGLVVCPFHRAAISAGTLQTNSAQQRQEEEVSSSGDESLHRGDALATDTSAQKSLPTYRKSLQLSSEQMGRLNLKDGPNKVAFSVTTQYQDTCCCKATMYLWNWNDKVVISDINSIITNSDALGHILPHLGKDWTHAKPFHKIHLHGYKFLCCSARPILKARITKGYPKWINEQGCALPRSPGLFSASRRYEQLAKVVELIFLPLGQEWRMALLCPECSHFVYWRPPLPAIDLKAFSCPHQL